VYKSTGFAKYQPRNVKLPEKLVPLHGAAREIYDELAKHRI
jgi:hypothetical protein